MEHPLAGFVVQALDRRLFLRRAEAAAEAVPAAHRPEIRAHHDAGDTRVDAALGEQGVPALVLARAAIPCYLRAAVTACGAEPPPAGAPVDALWELYDAAVSRGAAPAVPEALVAARHQTTSEQTLDAEVEARGDACVDEAIALAGFLAEAAELRTPGQVRFQRRLRQALLAVAGVALVVNLVNHHPSLPNLALKASVVSSSRRMGAGPPEELTNGTAEPGPAFATRDEPDPWVTVDLANPVRVAEVTFFAPPEHLEDTIPLRVETSLDGSAWEPAGTQTAPLAPSAPTVLKFPARSARFVRVHGRPGGAVYLNEVEVR